MGEGYCGRGSAITIEEAPPLVPTMLRLVGRSSLLGEPSVRAITDDCSGCCEEAVIVPNEPGTPNVGESRSETPLWGAERRGSSIPGNGLVRSPFFGVR